jgi:AmmeMemoRadiSam system protein B/AmmeMemoRadiSam system protein A
MKQHSFPVRVLCILGFLVITCASGAQDTGQPVNRPPVYAGSFYAGTKATLQAQLNNLFATAEPKKIEGRVRCLIVPHAGYSYSGVVAASGYLSIAADAGYKNIFVIAPSHREYFEGASVYTAGNYLTPLGEVRVNREIAGKLIRDNRFIRFNPRAHDREHSIEVQLPMIQYHFRDTPPIVPIVIGNSSVSTARDLAQALLPYFTPENLFIISSDFSHYPEYSDAVSIDRSTCDAVLQNDPKIFYNTLAKNSNAQVENLATPCCGWASVLTLLYMSESDRDMVMTPVLYRNSGDLPEGDKGRVVGYWAIVGQDPGGNDFALGSEDKEILLKISRQTLEMYLDSGQVPVFDLGGIPEILREPAGAFVSLYKHGQLRGCIGQFEPVKPLYQVVQEMSVAAATRDTRFYPVDESELGVIKIEISVLTPLKRIQSADEFELGRQGIYMKKDGRSGTFLPQVAESTGWNKEEFLGHCAMDKARIGWNGWKDAELFVYEAIVFGESQE